MGLTSPNKTVNLNAGMLYKNFLRAASVLLLLSSMFSSTLTFITIIK